jgi:hypothetical protein
MENSLLRPAFNPQAIRRTRFCDPLSIRRQSALLAYLNRFQTAGNPLYSLLRPAFKPLAIRFTRFCDPLSNRWQSALLAFATRFQIAGNP